MLLAMGVSVVEGLLGIRRLSKQVIHLYNDRLLLNREPLVTSERRRTSPGEPWRAGMARHLVDGALLA